MNTARCSSCQAEIIWVITEKGHKMPVDAKPMKGFWLEETHGQVQANSGSDLHQSHFATCPNADQHRKSQ